MRHLNSGEIKLFNVVKDMGETNDLTKQMPEKTTKMVQHLDAYLQKVGAWTMDEVYATRTEELEKWTTAHQAKVDQLNQQLNNPDLLKKDRAELSKSRDDTLEKIEHDQKNLDKLNRDQKSDLWF
jgi:valyl-tRNA synthetase